MNQITSEQLQDWAKDSKTCFDGGNHIFWQNLTDKLNKHIATVEHDATMAEHKSHTDFENELYATLVDPVAEGTIKEDEMRKQLLESARWHRQHAHDLENQLNMRTATEAVLREWNRRSAQYPPLEFKAVEWAKNFCVMTGLRFEMWGSVVAYWFTYANAKGQVDGLSMNPTRTLIDLGDSVREALIREVRFFERDGQQFCTCHSLPVKLMLKQITYLEGCPNWAAFVEQKITQPKQKS